MIFDWREYLKLAQYLRGYRGHISHRWGVTHYLAKLTQYLQGGSEQNFTKEAASRSAVSRAYYAAFCFARNYATDEQGFVPTHTARDHVLIREHFQRKQMSEIASQLEDLKQWRNFCDYDDIVDNLPPLLESSITEAEKLIEKLSSSSD